MDYPVWSRMPSTEYGVLLRAHGTPTIVAAAQPQVYQIIIRGSRGPVSGGNEPGTESRVPGAGGRGPRTNSREREVEVRSQKPEGLDQELDL